MTSEELDKIIAEATEGPWGMYDGFGPDHQGVYHCNRIGTDFNTAVGAHNSLLWAKKQDFEFVAAAREHWPRDRAIVKAAADLVAECGEPPIGAVAEERFLTLKRLLIEAGEVEP